MRITHAAHAIRRPLMGFFAMGLFWGGWGALIPQIRAATGASDGQLGQALLFVSVGAVPAMMLGGRLLDLIGTRLLPISILIFGLTAVLPALAGTVPQLGAALLLVGAGAGLMDVTMNARTGAIEAATGLRVMHFAHGTFAVLYLAAALLTGLARDAGASALPILAVIGALIVGLAALAASLGEPLAKAASQPQPDPTGKRRLSLPVLLLGLMVFAAFLAENGWQSWSALFLERIFAAGPILGSSGPATVGLAVALGRFGGQALSGRLGDLHLLTLATLVAIAGAVALSLAPTAPLALVALFIAAAGVSVIAPSALGLAGRSAPPDRRGAVVATVGVIGYTGFFAGPAILGLVAEAAGPRAALAVIALLLTGILPLIALYRRRSGPAVPD